MATAFVGSGPLRGGLLGRGAVRAWVLNLQCMAGPAMALSSGYPYSLKTVLVVLWYRSLCPHSEMWFCSARGSIHHRLVASAGGRWGSPFLTLPPVEASLELSRLQLEM